MVHENINRPISFLSISQLCTAIHWGLDTSTAKLYLKIWDVHVLPEVCLPLCYTLLLTELLRRCFSIGLHAAIASSICWAQLSRGRSASRRTRLLVHRIFTVQDQEDTEYGKCFFLTWGQARIIICPLHSTQGMLPGSYTLQLISPNSAANYDMLQCFRKIANRSWSDCTEFHISYHIHRDTSRTKTAVVFPVPHSSLQQQTTWYTRVGHKTQEVQWPKNFEFQTKISKFVTTYSLLFLFSWCL